jgi:aryl-alcohol dehydrogenase-like predicted oxidoreductase
VRTRTLGNPTVGTVPVSAIGLGEMPLSLVSRPSEDQAMRTVHAALDAGITLIDTADAYCAGPHELGHGERLVAKALATYGGSTDDVVVATKGGHLPAEKPGDIWPVDGTPEHLRNAVEASLKALGVEAIGLYQHHRPDPDVPYAETMGALKELHDAGKIRMAGISNADVDQIRTAVDVLGPALVSVQNQFAPNFRSSEEELLLCTELGLAFLPWSPLGGIGKADQIAGMAEFAAVAEAHGVSPQRVTLAWMLAKSPVVIPIPGSSRPETIADSAAAADLELTADEVARLDATD